MEASIRLLHAYSDCGITANELLQQQQDIASGNRPSSGNIDFVSLLRSLQQWEVVRHPHSAVQLVYFEISVRYVKVLLENDVLRLAQALVMYLQHLLNNSAPASGSRSPQRNPYMDHMRNKIANLLFKLAETLDNKSYLLLSIADGLQGKLLDLLLLLSVFFFCWQPKKYAFH